MKVKVKTKGKVKAGRYRFKIEAIEQKLRALVAQIRQDERTKMAAEVLKIVGSSLPMLTPPKKASFGGDEAQS